MANKKQLRVIARNVLSKVAIIIGDEGISDILSEEDERKLFEHIRQIADSLVSKCYRSEENELDKIIKDVLRNVK